MLKYLLGIKNSDLVLLSFAPVLLYGVGFALTGSQVFDPGAKPKEQAQVVQKIEPAAVEAPSELEKKEEERSKEKERTEEDELVSRKKMNW